MECTVRSVASRKVDTPAPTTATANNGPPKRTIFHITSSLTDRQERKRVRHDEALIEIDSKTTPKSTTDAEIEWEPSQRCSSARCGDRCDETTTNAWSDPDNDDDVYPTNDCDAAESDLYHPQHPSASEQHPPPPFHNDDDEEPKDVVAEMERYYSHPHHPTTGTTNATPPLSHSSAGTAAVGMGNHSGRTTNTTTTTSTTDETRDLVKQFIADIWNRGALDMIPNICSPSLRFNGNTGFDRVGHEGLARMVITIRNALDEYHCEIHSMVVEHNKAFCRLRFSGKHVGTLIGIAPTGQNVAWMGATEFTVQNHKILKVWELGDVKSLEEQLLSHQPESTDTTAMDHHLFTEDRNDTFGRGGGKGGTTTTSTTIPPATSVVRQSKPYHDEMMEVGMKIKY